MTNTNKSRMPGMDGAAEAIVRAVSNAARDEARKLSPSVAENLRMSEQLFCRLPRGQRDGESSYTLAFMLTFFKALQDAISSKVGRPFGHDLPSPRALVPPELLDEEAVVAGELDAGQVFNALGPSRIAVMLRERFREELGAWSKELVDRGVLPARPAPSEKGDELFVAKAFTLPKGRR